jgi:hypothetical protein
MILSNKHKVFFCLAAVCVFFAGCAGYGRLQWSDTASQAFQNYEMTEGYRYYYSGRGNKPSSIIGIDPAYEFSPDVHWNEIAPSDFRRMVDRMFAEYNYLAAAYILDPNGKRAGVWYSYIWDAVVKFDNGRIYVFSPEPADVKGNGGSSDNRDPA